MRVYLFLIAMSLAGCATQDRWLLNGRSEADFYQADAQCWQYAQAAYAESDHSMGGAAYSVGASGSAGLAGAMVGLIAMGEAGKDAFHESCLAANGYTKVKK